MPGASAGPAPPPLPSVGGGGRDDLLAAIRGSGGKGGGGLRKVSEVEKRDRSAAAVPGGESSAPAAASGTPASPGGGADGGGLAGALAEALSRRKKKVSGSGESFLDASHHSNANCLRAQMTKRRTMTIGDGLELLHCRGSGLELFRVKSCTAEMRGVHEGLRELTVPLCRRRHNAKKGTRLRSVDVSSIIPHNVTYDIHT
jgi:hypothetical protein